MRSGVTMRSTCGKHFSIRGILLNLTIPSIRTYTRGFGICRRTIREQATNRTYEDSKCTKTDVLKLPLCLLDPFFCASCGVLSDSLGKAAFTAIQAPFLAR